MIGTELDRTHRPKTEWNTILLTGVMVLLGFAIRFLVSNEPHVPFMLERSLVSTLIGIACMETLYYVDFTIIGRYSKFIFIGFTILTIITMHLSPVIRGQHAFVQFILLIFPVVMAGIIYNTRTIGFPIMTSNLPFISYSGMSTIINMPLIGMMLSVFRTGGIVSDSLVLQKSDL